MDKEILQLQKQKAARLNPEAQKFENLISTEIDTDGYLHFKIAVGDILQALSIAAQCCPLQIAEHRALIHQLREENKMAS